MLHRFGDAVCVAASRSQPGLAASDAHMRRYRLVVPRDCTAANSPVLKRWALDHIKTGLQGRTGLSSRIDFDALDRRPPRKA